MNLTLPEIEMLLAVCGRAGQTDDTLGKYFKSAKSKLLDERKKILGEYLPDSAPVDSPAAES